MVGGSDGTKLLQDHWGLTVELIPYFLGLPGD